MEVFSGTSDQFPEKISPFPSSFDSILAACEASGASTPDAAPFPPQKLRPIRCNGKSALVYRDSNFCIEAAFELQGIAEFDGRSSLDGVGGGLGALGFVTDLRDDLVEGGQAFRAGEVLTPAVDVDMMTAGKVEIKGRGQTHLADSSFSSESEVSGDLLENTQASGNRKKRRTTNRLEDFMEEVVSKVLLKQEMMHNNLMGMLERKERERMMREEVWNKQEMERLKREEHVRAQETARSVAIIGFIQNILGNDFQMDKPTKDEAEVYQQRDD